MKQENLNISISQPHPEGLDWMQKAALAIVALGVLVLLVAWTGFTFEQNTLFLSIALGGIAVGTVVYAIRFYHGIPEGIKNSGVWHRSLTNRGMWGWVLGIVLTGFYCMLYWAPSWLGYNETGNTGLTALFDPLSRFFKGKPASQWFVYGTIYTLLIFSLGIKFIIKYRHIRYQLIRTIVVIISQLFLAYLIPEILEGLNTEAPYFAKDIKYMWPLN